MQATSIRFWLCFCTTLPQSPSCGEGGSQVHRVQHSVVALAALFFSHCQEEGSQNVQRIMLSQRPLAARPRTRTAGLSSELSAFQCQGC